MKIIYTSDIHAGHSSKISYNIIHDFITDINEENPDILIIAGDLISHSQIQLEKLFKIIRSIIPSNPILIVRGNHDFWCYGKEIKINNYEELDKFQKLLFKKYNIQYLQDNPYIKDNVNIYGWDGWYKEEPMSNDFRYMFNLYDGIHFHDKLRSISHEKFTNIINTVNKDKGINIVVTHFNLIGQYRDRALYKMDGDFKYMDIIKEKFDYCIFGHSHKEFNEKIGNCKVLNSGSDYLIPQYEVINI
jgi:predicted phosphodiesterase